LSEDHPRPQMLPARLQARLSARRGLRRLTASGVPAVMAIGLVFPAISGTSAPGPATAVASRILCGSWSRCDSRGYDSYGYAASEYRAYWRMTPGDECTNYAAFVESTVYHVATPSYLLGDGGNWAYAARAHGVVVNHTPSVGAVAAWDGGMFGIGAQGHVAVVEQVGPDARYIVVSQQHMGGLDDYNWTRIKAGYGPDQWQEWPSYFIHFPIPRRADVGYFDPKADSYSVRYSQTAGPVNRTARLGVSGAVPFSGQWHRDAGSGAGYYSPKYGMFHLLGAGPARHPNVSVTFGPPGMVPLIGDWRGFGRDGIGYYDPKTATFTLKQSLRPGPAYATFRFGPRGMVPLAGDWNGKGRDGIGYYNPAAGRFSLRVTLGNGPVWVRFRFGPPHMIPIVGNWTGRSLRDGVGYYDPRTGTYYLRDRLSTGPASTIVRFGPAHMVPLTGQWYGA
jgi:surface antigen